MVVVETTGWLIWLTINHALNQTSITFEVCNACDNDVSHISIERFSGTHDAVTPIESPDPGEKPHTIDDYPYVGDKLEGNWLVSWTSTDGFPGFPSVKFDAWECNDTFKDGLCECFEIVYQGNMKDGTVIVRVEGKHGTFQEILNIPVPIA